MSDIMLITDFCPSPLHWGKNFTSRALSREWLLWCVLKMHHFTQLGFTDNLGLKGEDSNRTGWTHCWFAELRQLIGRLSSEWCEFFFFNPFGEQHWESNIAKIDIMREKVYLKSYLVPCPATAVLTSAAISVDRLLGLLLGLTYRHTLTLRRVWVVIVCFLLTSALQAA